MTPLPSTSTTREPTTMMTSAPAAGIIPGGSSDDWQPDAHGRRGHRKSSSVPPTTTTDAGNDNLTHVNLLSYFCCSFFYLCYLCGSVAEWLGSRTCDQQVAGSNPGRGAAECHPGQVVYTRVPLSASSIIWYRPMGADAGRRGEVTAGLVESNGSLPPGLWLRSPVG